MSTLSSSSDPVPLEYETPHYSPVAPVDARRTVRVTVSVAAVGFVVVWLFAVVGLRFDMFVSDVTWYWEDSLGWRAPYSEVHVPLYPLTLAALRGVSLFALPPLVYMWGVALVCHLVGVWAFTLSALHAAGREAGLWGGIIFGLWPLVGTSYAVFPVADAMTLALFAVGLLALQKERFYWASLAIGFALLANKAIWPVSLFVVLAAAWWHRAKLRNLVGPALLLPVPLLAYWFAGSVNMGSFAWPLSRYIQYGKSRSAVPILDGLFGAFAQGGASDLANAAVVWTMVLTALWLGLLAWWSTRTPERLYSLAIVAAALLGFALLNHAAIWAAVRYSRLLAFPLAWYFNFAEPPVIRNSRRSAIYALVAVVLLASQLAYLYYTSEIFFGNG